MENPKSTHILVLFCSPGPRDVESELRNLIPYLERNNGLCLAEDFKMRIMVESVSTATDFKKLSEAMKAWLDSEDKPLSVSIKEVGINAHGKQFKFFQAAWAIPQNVGTESFDIAESLDTADPLEILSTINAACLEFKSRKAQKSGSVMGGIFDKLLGRKK
jgi:hypothetical protein